MQIHIWTPSGELITFSDLSSWDSVAELQNRLAVTTGIAYDRQKLTFRGRHLERSHVLVEYGIHEHHQGIITVGFEEVRPCGHESDELGVSNSSDIRDYSDNLPLRHHCEDFGSKHVIASSETSTCLPSECTSDCGDVDSCGASVIVCDVISFTQGSSGDAFVDANSAHVKYLLLRHQRLEAAGLGVRTLCR